MRLYIVCAAFIAASGTVAAAESPEAAYAEFHRALMKDDFNALAGLSTNEGGRRMKAQMSGAQPPEAKAAQAISPAYRVVSKTVERDRAVLKLRAKGGTLQPDKVMAGEVVLLREAGGWKVHDMTWTPHDPGDLADAAPAKPVPPLPAAQLKDPEAVYAQFHRAMIAGDLATMERHSTADYYKDLASQAARIRDAAWLFSPFYSVTGRAIGDKRAVLDARGQAGPALGGGPMQGRIRLLRQGDEWRVDMVGWTPVSAQASTPQPPRPGIDTPVPVRPQTPPPRSAGSGSAAGATQKAQ